MSTDSTRRRGFCGDIARRLPARSLVQLRALDAALQVLERDDETEDTQLADAMRDKVRDIEAEERAQDEAHERVRDEMVPRVPTLPTGLATLVRIGLPGDDMSHPIVVPVDSDAPAATYRPAIRVVGGAELAELEQLDASLAETGREHARDLETAAIRPIRVVADEGEAPDELGGGG